MYVQLKNILRKFILMINCIEFDFAHPIFGEFRVGILL